MRHAHESTQSHAFRAYPRLMPNLRGLSMEDLSVLVAIVDSGSISSVASTLGYSQSGMSRRVAAIERAAGTPLLVRLARGVRATPAGERLREHAVRVLDELAFAERDLDRTPGRRPRLRIGAFSTANATIIPLALQRLSVLAPGTDVSVREHRSARLLAWVASGAADVAVVSDYPRPATAGADIRLEPLFDDPLAVAVPVEHPLASDAYTLADLADEHWIEGHRDETILLRDTAARAGFDPVVGHRVRDWNTKLAFVEAGLGVALVPYLALAQSRPGIVARVIDDGPSRKVSLATSAASAPSDVAATFVAVLRTVAASRPTT